MHSPLRVMIVSRIYRPEASAAAFFLGSVADSLSQAGHEVEVITARMPKGLAPEPRGERVRTFPVLRDRTGYVRGYLQYMSFDIPLFFRLLFARRPDVVFVEPPPTTGTVVRTVCALRRIPYVYDAADIWSDAADNATGSGVVIRVLRSLERFGMNGARRIVTISQGVADRIAELGIRRPVTVTGFGADTVSFRYEEASTEPVFLYAGSYSAWHGAEVLIDAFAEFSRTHPGYTLRFIGNSTERDALGARASARGISHCVEFFATVPATELLPHLSRAVASLATLKPNSGYDYAFTTKTYSALAAGCPVLFAGPGPTAPFLQEAARHVRAGEAVAYDAAAIARAMREIVDHAPDAQARAATARWTEQHHSMTAVAERVRAAIEAAAEH
ncbi:MAG: glycosyltransferase family 4 protein [Leucobacter sp.]